MSDINKNIIKELEKAILPLQGLKKLKTDNDIHINCKEMEQAFPDASFPIGCTHEFTTGNAPDAAATSGFITALLSKLLRTGGVCLWISTTRNAFPASLAAFAIQPDQIIFVDLKTEREALYATEEALKCSMLIAVLAELKNISFKESRRFQLAAEQSRVVGFIIRHQPKIVNAIASVSRWHITSLPSTTNDGLPGVGFPRWKVDLQKIRNGTPSAWIIEWLNNNFNIIKEEEHSSPQFKEIRMIG